MDLFSLGDKSVLSFFAAFPTLDSVGAECSPFGYDRDLSGDVEFVFADDPFASVIKAFSS